MRVIKFLKTAWITSFVNFCIAALNRKLNGRPEAFVRIECALFKSKRKHCRLRDTSLEVEIYLYPLQ